MRSEKRDRSTLTEGESKGGKGEAIEKRRPRQKRGTESRPGIMREKGKFWKKEGGNHLSLYFCGEERRRGEAFESVGNEARDKTD